MTRSLFRSMNLGFGQRTSSISNGSRARARCCCDRQHRRSTTPSKRGTDWVGLGVTEHGEAVETVQTLMKSLARSAPLGTPRVSVCLSVYMYVAKTHNVAVQLHDCRKFTALHASCFYCSRSAGRSLLLCAQCDVYFCPAGFIKPSFRSCSSNFPFSIR